MQAKLGLRYDSDRQISLAVCLQVFLVGIKNMLIQAFEGLYENNMLLNLREVSPYLLLFIVFVVEFDINFHLLLISI